MEQHRNVFSIRNELQLMTFRTGTGKRPVERERERAALGLVRADGRGWAVACKYCFRPCPRDIADEGIKEAERQRAPGIVTCHSPCDVKVGFRATEVVAKYDPKRRGKCGNMIYTREVRRLK